MFKNKIALITGGTKGIGKTIALEFLNAGAKVVVVYSSDDSAVDAMKAELGSELAANLTFYKGSVSDEIFVENVMKDVKAKFGKLDILINNAGVTKDGFFLEMTEEDWDKVLNINLKGSYLFSFFAFDLMKKNADEGLSYIVNMSSISGAFGKAGQVNYSTSKGAVLGMTKLFARKYSEFNINVNSMLPGLIDTEMARNVPEDKIAEIVNTTIKKRMGQPKEIAKSVLYLCSENSSYMTGSGIAVDGGFMK